MILSIFLLFCFYSSVHAANTANTEAGTTGSVVVSVKSVKNGWVKKNGFFYYYQKGKRATGWKKIAGKYYFFNKYGQLQRNEIVGTKASGYYYVDKYGVRISASEGKAAVKFVQQYTKSTQSQAEKLKICFQALCKYPYLRSYDNHLSEKSMSVFAAEMFANKKGNCYRYAAAMAYIAKVLGYDSRVAVGGTTAYSGELSPHGWCEVKIGNTWRMLDCSMQNAHKSVNLYLRKRADYPYRLRCDNTYTLCSVRGTVSWKKG